METNKKFLKERAADVTKHHQEYLGLDIPENYFATSKSKILAATVTQKTTTLKLIKNNNRLKIYSIAASIALLVSLGIWYFSSQKEAVVLPKNDLLVATDDVLLNSILLNDADFEAYTNQLLIEEVVIKAELSEQKLDNMLLNSLFVEDSLIDGYTENKLIEQIIL